MIVLLQRVTHASVAINNQTTAEIGQGLLALVGFEPSDNSSILQKMADRLLKYRVFSDQDNKMNLSVSDINGGVLVVPQFTLAADTSSGLRPGFSAAASPADGLRLFDAFKIILEERYQPVTYGEFGADMQVSLVNDGPVTFWLQSNPHISRGRTFRSEKPTRTNKI